MAKSLSGSNDLVPTQDSLRQALAEFAKSTLPDLIEKSLDKKLCEHSELMKKSIFQELSLGVESLKQEFRQSSIKMDDDAGDVGSQSSIPKDDDAGDVDTPRAVAPESPSEKQRAAARKLEVEGAGHWIRLRHMRTHRHPQLKTRKTHSQTLNYWSEILQGQLDSEDDSEVLARPSIRSLANIGGSGSLPPGPLLQVPLPMRPSVHSELLANESTPHVLATMGPMNDNEDPYQELSGDDDFELYHRASTSHFLKSVRKGPCSLACVGALVNTSYFEYASGFLIVMHALFLGIQTEYLWQNMIADFIDLGFVIMFTVEIFMRLAALQSGFHWTRDRRWLCFDIVFVMSHIVIAASTCLPHLLPNSIDADLTWLRTVRMFRLIRTVRLVRLFHHLEPLAILVASILNSVIALNWALLLLAIMIYWFSMFFTDLATVAQQTADDAERLRFWFGSLSRSALTLYYSIVGGVSWFEIADLLSLNISPAVGAMFCFYVGLCIFIFLNIVTGVFVDQCISTQHADLEETTTKNIRDLFITSDNKGCVTLDEFKQKIKTKEMKAYFKQINVCQSEGVTLFKLLDADHSGTLDSAELVDGLLRLRGSSTALELSLLARRVATMHSQAQASFAQLHELHGQLCSRTRQGSP